MIFVCIQLSNWLQQIKIRRVFYSYSPPLVTTTANLYLNIIYLFEVGQDKVHFIKKYNYLFIKILIKKLIFLVLSE